MNEDGSTGNMGLNCNNISVDKDFPNVVKSSFKPHKMQCVIRKRSKCHEQNEQARRIALVNLSAMQGENKN